MGTNYYARIDECPHCKRGSEDLHIGKSSAGWEFLFAPNRDRGIDTAAKWWEFLKDQPIYDEYGEKVSLTDLQKRVENKKGGMTAKNASREIYGDYSPAERAKHEVTSEDGYRFSTSEDFS